MLSPLSEGGLIYDNCVRIVLTTWHLHEREFVGTRFLTRSMIVFKPIDSLDTSGGGPKLTITIFKKCGVGLPAGILHPEALFGTALCYYLQLLTFCMIMDFWSYMLGIFDDIANWKCGVSC